MTREIMVPTHRRPTLPGEFIREYLQDPELHLTQGDLANRLRISRANLSAIINGRRAITPAMAMRLERVLGVSMQTWLNLQTAVNIYDTLHSPEAKEISKLKPLRKPAA